MNKKDIADIIKMAASIILNKKDPEVKPGGLDRLNVQMGLNAEMIAELYYIKTKKGKIATKKFESYFSDEFLGNLYNKLRGGKQTGEKLTEGLKHELLLDLFNYAKILGLLD